MSQLFSPSYWFTMSPPQVGGTLGNIVFGVFLLLFVVGIVARIVASNRTEDPYIQQIGRRVGSMFVTMGLIGVLLFFFGFEHIQFFGGRFWYPLWVIGVLVWGFFIVRYVKRDIPAMRLRDLDRKEQSRYLPKKKRKKKKRRR